MDNFKRNYLKRTLSLVLAVIMIITLVPLGVFAQDEPNTGKPTTDALSSATYYRKANWENKIKDKSRWPVGDDQRLVRVTTSEPVQMNDIDYDGNFVDADGRTVLRMVYKEKGGAATGVWYRARFNFGELDQYIDYAKSYMVGLSVAGNESGTYPLTPVNGQKEREVDLGKARGDLTNQRKNLPINLVLNEGVTIKDLGQKNYIVQMRLTDVSGKKIYAYAPKGTSMDYSTYTKTTSVSLEDKVNRLFIKGGYQKDGNNATAQEFVMSEFIANPDQYDDKSNLGIIRTQYTGQRAGSAPSPTTGGQAIAFTQVFDANLLNYLKADKDGNVAYVNVFENTRLKSNWPHDVGIKLTDFNKTADEKLAYLVIAPKEFKDAVAGKKTAVNVVEIPKHDQYTMLQGFYITGIDYVVDKGLFEDTFAGRTAGIDRTRKLNYSMISGWTNPNKDGWTIYEKTYEDGYVAHEGESYLIDTTSDPTGGQIMIQIGNDDAIIRKQQGYYSYYITGNKGIETIEEYAKGVFKFDLREGATIKAGDKLRVFMPYTKDHKDPVNFLEIHNGTKLNEGGATLTLQKDRNINMHLYTDKPRGASFKLKYTLAQVNKKGEKEGELVFSTPKIGTFWQYKDNDKVLTGVPNTSILSSAGNFYINTTKLEPGKDIIVEAYDENGKEIVERKSWFKYRPLDKSKDNVKELTWTDSSDKSSILSINKSLYTPYQVLFTNDYKDGTDDFYKDPKVLPASNDDFKKDTKEFVGYTKYDGGKVRTLYEEGKTGKLYAKVEADENEYDKDGNLVGKDVSKKITIPKSDIFDAQFDGDNKEYRAYEYKVDLTKMLPYHKDNKTETKLTLLKDMKFVSTASDGSSLPSDLLETRVRARVLFDANTGKLTENGKQVDKVVKIAPDNVDFFDQKNYNPNGFEGANVKEGTGDKFPDAPKKEGKNFLGWVTEEGKQALGKAVVTADEFNALSKDQIFTNETPITKHLVVYAVYSDEVTVTFDANQGKFTDDGKDTKNVKVEGGNVTAPTPTRDGYKFIGWAADKNATEADANILNNVKAPKTVYAVWEKNDKEPLQLNDPTPVEVKDTKSLTSDEIDKVKDAVIKTNPTLTKADITVAEDGTVTVTKDGKTGTLGPAKTVKQKEVQNQFNPPKEPVPVDEIGNLKAEEIAAIKQAVKDANPERNFKDEEITVNNDGSVSINQGGKVGTIPANKTVVQKDTILKLDALDEKVEVKDPTNLTKDERAKVAEAVKQKNNLPNTATIDVDSKGNVTVTVKEGEKTKTGKLKAEDTVKPFTRDGKKLNPPANKVKVGDTNKLTDAEKQAVREEVKKANPDLGFKDEEIQVDDNGLVTVPITDSKNETFEPAQTIEKATDADKTIKLVAPEKTIVNDITKLSDEEKGKVIAAVKKANPSIASGYDITVSDDGAVTVTQGTGENQKVGQLSQADTVLEKLKAPTVEAVADGSVKVIPNNKESDTLEISFGDAANPTKVTAKKENGEWKLAEGTDKNIKIDKETGTVTIPASMLSKNKEVKAKEKAGTQESPEATGNSNDTTAPGKPEVKAEDDGSVKVTPPTDADTKSVTIAYKDKDGHDQTLTATKGDDGTWILPAGTDTSITIDPATGVVKLPKDKIKAGEKVTAKAKDANDNESAAGEATPVNKADLKAEVDKNNNDAIKNSDKYKNADQTKKDAYDTALDKANKVLEDPNALQKDIDDALKALKDAEAALDGTAKPADELKEPAKVAVKNPANLTDGEKAAIKDAVKKANSGLKDDQIKVNDDGSVTVTKDGKETTIVKDKTISTDVKTPALTEVTNKTNLNDDEKLAVKKAVEDANKDGLGNSTLPEGATITVGNDGTVTVKDKDGKETIIPASSVVKEKAQTPGTPAAPTVKANDDGSVEITPAANDDNTKSIEVTYIPEGQTSEKTITFEKDTNGNWKKKDGSEIDPAITIDANGKITIPENKVKDSSDVKAVAKNGDGSKSSAEATAKTKSTADITDPTKPTTKVKVGNPSNLTQEEQNAVKTAIENANKTSGASTLPEGTNITVGSDGTATIKYPDGSTDTISGSDLVEQDTTLPKEPTVTAKDDGSVEITSAANDDNTKSIEVTYIPEGQTSEKTITFEKDTNGNWKKKDGSEIDPAITIDANGKITIPENKVKDSSDVKAVAKNGDGSKSSAEATAKTKSTADITDPTKPTTKVKVGNPSSLTQEEQNAVKTAIENANTDKFPTGTKVDVDNTGKATIKYPDGSTDTINANDLVEEKAEADKTQADKYDPTVPAKTKVADKTNLNKDEKDAVKKAIEDANKDKFPQPKEGQQATKVEVGADGTATITYPDGSVDTIKGTDLVEEKAQETKPAAPTVTANDDCSVTVTPPENAKEVSVTYTPEGADDPVTVTATKGNDNKWTLPADAPEGLQINPNTGEITIPADKIKGGTEVSAVAKDAEDKSSDPAKADAKLDSNEDLDFDLLDFGNIDITPVANMYLLTDDEKNEVENKVKAAVDAAIKAKKPTAKITPSIEVADDGTVTVSLGNKTKTIDSVKTVEQKSDGLAVKPAKPIPVDNPNQLTDAEKKAIEDAIRNANHPDLDNANIEVNDEGKVTITTPNGKSATIPANKTRTKKSIPDYADIYYPDTTIGVGDERRIYPSGYPGYVSILPGDIDAPRGVYVRVNHDGSVDVEISPRYTGPSMFTITGYVDVDGKIAPISIRIRVIDDVRSDRRRQRMDKRDEMDKEDELIDTREVLTHKAYIFGYPDGNVRPNGFITRAEAAAMLSRLLEDENTASALKPAFSDTPSKWYNKAINAVVARGIMRGYSDGTFRPNAPITRAEFAQMISAIDAKPFGTAPFADVKGHWAELAIGKEYAAGRISGYPNGTFRPDAPITRAEAAHILNKIFERNYDLVSALQSNDKGNIKFFTDLSTSFWGYNDMIEATNTHTFRRRVKGMVQEDWSEINR